MIPPVVADGRIGPHHVAALETIRRALAASHRPPDDVERLDAHTLCSSAEMVLRNYPPGLEVRHYRGKFFGFEHSWLVFEREEVILDVYPILAGSGPLLVSSKRSTPWAWLYMGEPVPTLAEEVG